MEIHLDGCTVTLGGRAVLSDLDLRIPSGEVVGVIGSGGSGKSTFLKLLTTLISPSSGTVLLDGRDPATVGRETLRAIRFELGMAFQQVALFDSLTAWENIAFPMEQAGLDSEVISSTVTELLALLEMEGAEAKYPSELSGGMQRRIGIGRAMAAASRLLVLDDPAAGLDPELGAEVLAKVVARGRDTGQTIVIGASDHLPLLRHSTRFVLLHGGRILLEGPRETFDASEDPTVKAFFAPRGGG